MLSPACAIGAVIFPKTLPNCCAASGEIRPCWTSPAMLSPICPPTLPTEFVPKFDSLLFCWSLRSDTSRVRCSYPAIPVMRGRYLVLADLWMFSAILAVIFDIFSCLLFCSAISLHCCKESTPCAVEASVMLMNNAKTKGFFIAYDDVEN